MTRIKRLATTRNPIRNALTLTVVAMAIFVLPGAAVAQEAEDPAFGRARKSAEIAGHTISKVQRWLHKVAL
ncbi:MAG: hypothetical protein ACYSWZ_20455, partial [Planctomycetota bacterium]